MRERAREGPAAKWITKVQKEGKLCSLLAVSKLNEEVGEEFKQIETCPPGRQSQLKWQESSYVSIHGNIYI